jgi:hypothetical protein
VVRKLLICATKKEGKKYAALTLASYLPISVYINVPYSPAVVSPTSATVPTVSCYKIP